MLDFDLSDIQVAGSPGLDSMLSREAHIVAPFKTGRKMVASLGDLHGFLRLSSDTLIHKSNQDLWTLHKESDGKYYIERLFDDNGEPIKG